MNEYKKQWYQDNKDKINEKHKQYRIDNADKIKQYRLDNKEQIKEKKNQKHNCECGGRYTSTGKSKHLKTKLHQAFIQTI